jgi:hypothetical protein
LSNLTDTSHELTNTHTHKPFWNKEAPEINGHRIQHYLNIWMELCGLTDSCPCAHAWKQADKTVLLATCLAKGPDPASSTVSFTLSILINKLWKEQMGRGEREREIEATSLSIITSAWRTPHHIDTGGRSTADKLRISGIWQQCWVQRTSCSFSDQTVGPERISPSNVSVTKLFRTRRM